MIGVLFVLGAYLLGSIPFSRIVARRTTGADVLLQGTRNPGASNVWRLSGRKAGALAGLADFLKGVVPILLARAAGLESGWQMAAGVSAVLGHDFSPFLGFRGGKGGATSLGFFVCFAFPELLVVGLLWAGGMLVLQDRRFLWSLMALSTLPFLSTFDLFSRGWSQVGVETLLILLLWSRVAPGLRSRERDVRSGQAQA